MRKLLSTTLLASLTLAACSDRAGTIVTDTLGPEAPINSPDTGVIAPGDPGGSSTTQPSNGGGVNGGTAGSGTGEPGNGQEEPIGGGNPQGGTAGSAGETGSAGVEPGGGGSGAQPVPEPGTLLLVGTGLAGIGASLRRRRRRLEEGSHH